MYVTAIDLLRTEPNSSKQTSISVYRKTGLIMLGFWKNTIWEGKLGYLTVTKLVIKKNTVSILFLRTGTCIAMWLKPACRLCTSFNLCHFVW